MARYFIIRTLHESPMRPNGYYWQDEPNGTFDSIAEAEAAIQSLVDVCGYDPDTMRIIEITD